MDILQTIGILDLIFIVVLAISTILGLIRGMVREILSLVGLGASIYLAFTFSDSLSKNYLSQFLENPRISYIVTFVLIIVATLFVVTLINLLFSQLLRASGLSLFNRFFGAIFGALRGAVICSILVMILAFIPGITSKPWWQESTLAPTFQRLTQATFKYLPKEINDYFESAKETVSQATSEIVPLPTGSGNNSASNNTEPQLRPNRSALTDEQMRLVLQSIEASRQDSHADGNETTNAPNNNSNNNETEQKPQLILESYQETN